jgi:hypothetical protein
MAAMGLKKETKIESRTAVRTGFTGRAAIGYDHGYDAEVFYDPEGRKFCEASGRRGSGRWCLMCSRPSARSR